MITQKIQVKRYKSLSDIVKGNSVITADPLADIDNDDTTTIYGATEESESTSDDE